MSIHLLYYIKLLLKKFVLQKLVKAATCPLITKEHIWKHFEEVIVPGKPLLWSRGSKWYNPYNDKSALVNLATVLTCMLLSQARWHFSPLLSNHVTCPEIKKRQLLYSN